MPTTTTYTVDCACCGGGGCPLCESLPTDLVVTLGNNTWFVQLLFGVVIDGYPWCDCLETPDVSDPPPYDTAGTFTVSPIDFPLTWDAMYEVRTLAVGDAYDDGTLVTTGAWVYSGECTDYDELRILFYCDPGTAMYKLVIIWLSPAGDVYGYISITAVLGATSDDNENTCSPVYIQFGDLTAGGSWDGSPPDQSITGNVVTLGDESTKNFCNPTMWATVTE